MSHCPLCPARWTATLTPSGSGRNGVMIVSDALAQADAHTGRALVGREGAMLARALSRYGWAWSDFWTASAAWCQPPPALAHQAVRQCSAFDAHVRTVRPRVYLTLGALAFEKLVGLRVPPLLARGYVWPALTGGWVVAALPPAYYRQDTGLITTFLSDAAKAVRIAADGSFAYDATIRTAWQPDAATWDAYVRDFLTDPSRPLAADIETPWKRKADMTEAEKAANDDASWTIDEVNLCYDGVLGVSVPWTDAYRPGVLAMLAASQAHGVTLFWNAAYDVPRLEHNGVPAFSPTATRDTMDVFRVWRNNVRRKLVVATSLLPSCWNVKPWKHLGTADPFYRAMDVISLWRNDRDLFALLAAEGQLDAYRLFVSDLDPHLHRMTDAGMGLDAGRITSLIASTGVRLTEMQAQMTAVVDPSLLPTQTWKGRRAAEAALVRLRDVGEVLPDAALAEVPGEATAMACSACGTVPVDAAHVTRKYLSKGIDTAGAPA